MDTQSLRAAIQNLLAQEESKDGIRKDIFGALGGEKTAEEFWRAFEEALEGLAEGDQKLRELREQFRHFPKPDRRALDVFYDVLVRQRRSLPSGVSVSLFSDEETGATFIQLSDLVTKSAEPGEPWLDIEIPPKEGDPVLTLYFCDKETRVVLARGEPVWQIIESVIGNLPQDPLF